MDESSKVLGLVDERSNRPDVLGLRDEKSKDEWSNRELFLS